jgi:hypothetical protein
MWKIEAWTNLIHGCQLYAVVQPLPSFVVWSGVSTRESLAQLSFDLQI